MVSEQIKPLEWDESFTARSVGGTYRITGESYLMWEPDKLQEFGFYPDDDAAIRAANRNHERTIRSALVPAPVFADPAEGWQPIETAPLDQIVLVWGIFAGEISGVNKYPSIGIACHGDEGDFPGFFWHECGGDYYASWCKPSHWQPLPRPPSSTHGEQG